MKEFEFFIKIHKTTDKKKLADGTTQNYGYGTINVRKPFLAKYIGKVARVRVSIDEKKE